MAWTRGAETKGRASGRIAEPTSAGAAEEVLRDLALLLGVGPERLRAALAPFEGPSLLLRGEARSLAHALPARARSRLEALVRLYPVWDAAQARPAAITGPEDVARHMGRVRAALKVEGFWVIALDARGRPLATVEVARGTLSACLVHPRECFAPLIALRAASVIMVHNHPSGDPRPSREDFELTRRLTEAGELLGIPVLDHVVISAGGFRSVLGTS